MKLLDPSDFVDREVESKRFEALLAFTTPRRILVVSDESGWGKSEFLRKLRHICDYQGIPAALTLLNELPYQDEFTLALEVGKQLRRVGASLESFHRLNEARSFEDTGAFTDIYRSLQGTLNAGGAWISGGQVGGIIFNVQHAKYVGRPDWSDEANIEAKQVCLEAFLYDLLTAARRHPIVVMIDAFERADEELRRWLLLTFLQNRILAKVNGDCKLLVVLAGEHLEQMLRSRFSTFDVYFECIHALGSWTLADTVRMLEVQEEFDGLLAHEVENLHRGIVAREVCLTDALAIARIYRAKRLKR